MRYRFEWDPAKEKANIHKHKVSFRKAATVFRDPNQLSIYDQEHSEDEDRWITMGIDGWWSLGGSGAYMQASR